MKDSFPKRVFKVNAKLRDRVLGKSSSEISKYTCTYTYMKSSFPKQNLQTWDWNLKPISWNGAYRVLEKSFLYVHEYMLIYGTICVYTHIVPYNPGSVVPREVIILNQLPLLLQCTFLFWLLGNLKP